MQLKLFLFILIYISTEEFIAKYKRGYSNSYKDGIKSFLDRKLDEYFEQNKITIEKINYIEKELKINLLNYRIKYYFSKLFMLFY